MNIVINSSSEFAGVEATGTKLNLIATKSHNVVIDKFPVGSEKVIKLSPQFEILFIVVLPGSVVKFCPINVKLVKSIKVLIQGFNSISNDFFIAFLQQHLSLLSLLSL